MMEQKPLDNSMVLTLLGAMFTLFIGVAGHLYKRINEVEEKVAETVINTIAGFRREVAEKLGELAAEMHEFRSSRYDVAAKMVTKEELNAQIDRLVGEFRSRNTGLGERPQRKNDF